MKAEVHRSITTTSTMFLLVGAVFVWFTLFSDNICQAEVPFFHAKVIRIVDGDTIEIQQKKKVQRVRIWGIDTPERDQAYAQQAGQFTSSWLSGREVQVFPKDYDRYGRLVAMILVDNKNISEELIRSGFAWVHIYYCNEAICDTWKSLQERAMSEHRGLWNDSHPVAPWEWKKKHSIR